MSIQLDHSPEERETAREQANAAVLHRHEPKLPPEPQPTDFARKTISKYPREAVFIQVGILIAILFFGFVPSAMRVFSYGSELFSHVISNPWASGAAGVSLVIMAELSQIGFSLARVFTDEPEGDEWLHPKHIFLFGMIAATAVALIFNVESTIVRSAGALAEGEAFVLLGLTVAGWLEALFPPLFVLFGAHGLVEIILRQMEETQRQSTAYSEAHREWRDLRRVLQDEYEAVRKDPSVIPGWQREYRMQIKNTLIVVNKHLGQAALSGLPNSLWARLIAREIRSETELDEQISKLLEADIEQVAIQEDAAQLPMDFTQGS